MWNKRLISHIVSRTGHLGARRGNDYAFITNLTFSHISLLVEMKYSLKLFWNRLSLLETEYFCSNHVLFQWEKYMTWTRLNLQTHLEIRVRELVMMKKSWTQSSKTIIAGTIRRRFGRILALERTWASLTKVGKWWWLSLRERACRSKPCIYEYIFKRRKVLEKEVF